MLLVLAGAGSGTPEVMARRIASLIAVGDFRKESIVAFTFTGPFGGLEPEVLGSLLEDALLPSGSGSRAGRRRAW
jgi:UvrD/REP helicase N-terminal domain